MRRRTMFDDGGRDYTPKHLKRDDGLIWFGIDQSWTPEQMHEESKFHYDNTGPPDYPNWKDDPSYHWRDKKRGRRKLR